MRNNILKVIIDTIKALLKDREMRFSFFSIVVIVIVATLLLSLNKMPKILRSYDIGDIAREDIRISRDIHYVDQRETEIKKKRAAESVPVVFDKDPNVLNEKLHVVGILMDHVIKTLEDNPPLGTDDVTFQLVALKTKLPKYLRYNDYVLSELLKYKRPRELKNIINKLLIHIYDNNYDNKGIGVIGKPYSNPLKINNKNITIRTITDNTVEISKTLDDLRTVAEVKKDIHKIIYAIAPKLSARTRYAVSIVLLSNLKPNIKLNVEETSLRINGAIKKVKPVMRILKKGRKIVREGDIITPEILDLIKIHNRYSGSSHISFIFGTMFIQFIFLLILGFFILRFRQVLIPDSKSALIIFTLTIAFMIYTFIIARSGIVTDSKLTFVLLLPIPFVTMIISILYNIYLAMLVGLHIVFFTTIMTSGNISNVGGDISTMVLAFSSALLGVFVNSNVERRTDFLRGGLLLGVFNALVIIAISLVEEIPVMKSVTNIQIAFGSGMVNSILVLGILPIYENLFGITTKFRLLELSDLNANIFKEMLVKAPGTYNHSLIVSTMAEAACRDVNANYMMARVGAFYHDIGKIQDAGMYIENKVTDPRAKTLSAREYCQLIIAHVHNGVEIARKDGIPESIIDFIRAHHGKSTMAFFYHQALEEADAAVEDVKIVKSDFQYPGPKPQSKEIAIVMLADAIEATSRSIEQPTKEKLEGMVRKIIYNKLNEGELDESDLSMTDLNTIQKSFLKILNGIFHTRIEYPDKQELQSLEKKLAKYDKN